MPADRSPVRIGWVIGDQLERSPVLRAAALTSGGVGQARFTWLAARVNGRADLGLRYELYRPWRRHDGLYFLKSMGPRSLALLGRARARRRLTIFDVNVNYYERSGREHYQGMLPSAAQERDAIAMTRAADAVVADSEFLLARCQAYASRTSWIPDNVETTLVPPYAPTRLDGRRIRLLWSGEAVKLFELLAIEEVLRHYAARLELVLVTNSLSALGRWPADQRTRFEALLRDLPHTVVPYRGIPALFLEYGRGGVFVSPRFLDNTYNLGHTEWKITLAMACGRVALASPVPSYVTVADRAGHRGIRVCKTAEDWARALDALLAGAVDLPAEEQAARDVVARHYATAVVAEQHAALVRGWLAHGPRRD